MANVVVKYLSPYLKQGSVVSKVRTTYQTNRTCESTTEEVTFGWYINSGLNVRTENSLNSIIESTCGTIEEVSFEWSYHRISSTDIESFESSAEEVLFEW